MTPQQKDAFEKLWTKLKNDIHRMNFFLRLGGKVNQNTFQSLNDDIIKTEKEQNISIISYTLFMFKDNPSEFLSHFRILYYISYNFECPHVNEPPLITQMGQLNNERVMLEYLLSNMVYKEFNTFIINATRRSSDLKDPSDKHPLFLAVMNEQIDLIGKMLTIKPTWISLNIYQNYNALMIAVYFRKKASILKLLEYHQDVYQNNTDYKNLAHLACNSRYENWIIELINDPVFAQLRIADMLFDAPILNRRYKHPILNTFLKGHYTTVNILLKKAPHLRDALLFAYESAEHVYQFELLDTHYQVDIFSEHHHAFLVYQLERNLFQKSAEIINWYLNHPHMNSNLQNAYKIFHAAYLKDWNKVDYLFENISIDWDDKPTFIPFMITKLLIENQQVSIIIKHQLFDLHPHFHQIIDEQKTLRCFFDFIDTKKEPNYFIKKHPDFAHYFLNFLERNPLDYPLWGASYYGHLEDILMLFPLDKNMYVHGQPLLHFLVDYFFQNYHLHSPWEKQLQLIIDETVNLNAVDSSGYHLFTKLISQKNGLQVIQNLKKHFPGFHFHELDGFGSNLLHLVIEKYDIEALAWCLHKNQSLDVCTERASDDQSPLEIAFSLGHHDMVEQMRKKVKKNQYLEFLKRLIQKQSEALIDYLLQFTNPFGWDFSKYHQNDIKKLPHPKMVNRWATEPVEVSPALNVTEVVPEQKPVAIILTSGDLETILKTNHLKRIESLKQAQYQSSLAELFENDEAFLKYLEMAFLASDTKMNKIFMRIPAVQARIPACNAWHSLFTKAIDHQQTQLAMNLIERESIRKTLQEKAPFYLSKILSQTPSWYKESLHVHFPIVKHMIPLIQLCLEQSNVDALLQLFQWVKAPFPPLHPDMILKIMGVPGINQAIFISQFQEVFLYAIHHQNKDAMIHLHQSPLFNEHIAELIPHLKEKDISWLLSIWEEQFTDHAMIEIFKSALELPHEALVLQFLDNPKCLSILQTKARALIELGLRTNASLWAQPLLSKLELSLTETYELFDFIQANRNDNLFNYFVTYTPSLYFLKTLNPSDWLALLEDKEIAKHLISDPNRLMYIQNNLSDIFVLALVEKKISILEWLFTHKSLQEKLRLEAHLILNKAHEKLKISECIDHFQFLATEIDWHECFEQVLIHDQISMTEQFLAVPKCLDILQEKSLHYYMIAINVSNAALKLLHPRLKLDSHEQIWLLKAILGSRNPSDIKIFQAELLALFEHSEIHAHIVDIFLKALMSNQIEVCQEILNRSHLREVLYHHAQAIIYQAKENNCLNDLIGLWMSYQTDLKRPINPYIIAAQISLPRQISTWMQILKQPNQVCFLVGSTIDALLNHKKIITLNDFDFVGSASPPSQSSMVQSRVQPKLFFTSMPIQNKIMKIEYFVNCDADAKHFIAQDFMQRDFTVNSLYADEHGHVYDPTGMGLADLSNQLIRTISAHPSQCFQEDPIRLIRAIRLMTKGFKIERETENAIYGFKSTMEINFGHLYAMCSNLFQSPQGERIFSLMKKYHLIGKLLKCDELETFETIKSFVQAETDRHKYISITAMKK